MRPALARNLLVALAVGGAGCVAGAILVHRSRAGEADAAPVELEPSEAEAPPEPPADWCAPGFDAIEGGACLAMPHGDHAESLIVYLHGRYARDASSDEVDRQRRLGAHAAARGAAVLALRGRLGACTAAELAAWYCWPSNETNADAGSEVVGRWTRALAAAQKRTQAHRRYVLGFSNGGYFAGLIASRGLLDADAFVVAHGGPVEPVAPLRGMPPLLLLSADDDVAQDEMIRFDEELARVHWAHDSYARGGAHGLGDDDIEAALTFFGRAGEALPLQPPLSLHRAVRHDRDAGADTGIQTDEAPSDDAGPSVETTAPAPRTTTASPADEGDGTAPPGAPDVPSGDD
jgi:predicted esterase